MKQVLGSVLLLSLLCLLPRESYSSSYKSYKNYKILRVAISSGLDYEKILELESQSLVEILSEGHGGYLDILVPPGYATAAMMQLNKLAHLEYTVLTEDVEEKIEQERTKLGSGTPLAEGEFSYDDYHSLGVINAHLEALAAAHPDKAHTFNLPGNTAEQKTTYEGREIKVIRLTNNIQNSSSDEKPLIWLDGGIHAREWVSPATVMFIVDSLLGNQEQAKATEMNTLLDKYQFVIGPVINPDGYEYTQFDRLWRKTRKPSGCRAGYENWFGGCYYKMCYGTDPNRNWDAHFGEAGTSSNPCSLVYPGTEPFDQHNTNLVKEFLTSQQRNLVLYVTYHSYSQLFLTPWGYTVEKPINYDHHQVVGQAVVAAIQGRHGVKYRNIRASELYPASGGSLDWVHDQLGVVDSYCFELRDTGEYGFELPAEQIQPTGEENVDGLLALIDNIADNNNNTD